MNPFFFWTVVPLPSALSQTSRFAPGFTSPFFERTFSYVAQLVKVDASSFQEFKDFPTSFPPFVPDQASPLSPLQGFLNSLLFLGKLFSLWHRMFFPQQL